MDIKIAQDYNRLLCPGGCCPLELCAEPDKTCESLDGQVEVAYQTSITTYLTATSSYDVKYYQTTKWIYGEYDNDDVFQPNGGFRQWKESQTYNAWQEPLGDPDTWKSLSYVIQTSAAPLTGSIVVQNLDLINLDSARSAGEAALLAATRWGVSGIPYDNSCDSFYNKLTATGFGSDELAFYQWSRYKWSLPSSLTTYTSAGSTFPVPLSAVGYYQVKWDIAKATQEWLDWYDDYTYWKETTWASYLLDLESWNACMSAYDYDTEICGTKPEKPVFPGLSAEPTPAPVFVSNYTWTYTSPTSSSNWYETEPVDSGLKYSVFNLTSQCYLNTSWGVLPSGYGRRYDF